MRYPYLLFDLDGTVTDPKVGITTAVAHALHAFGIHVEDPDTLTPFIGPPLRDSFREFYGFTREQADLAIVKYREYYSAAGIYENFVYPGMEDLLKKLQAQGRTVILATSKPTMFAVPILERFALSPYFQFVSGSDPDEVRVEKWEVIEYALEQCGIRDRSRALMIGDRKHDVLGARRTGLDSAGVLYGYGGREELEHAGASYLAESVEDLSLLLDRL